MKPVVTVYTPNGPPRMIVNYRMSVHLGEHPATFGYEALLSAPLPMMRDIVAEVARRHGVSVEDIKGERRFKHIVRARQEAMWLMRQVRCRDGRNRFSYPAIGRFLGARDHTTVLFGERRHQARLDVAEASRSEWSMVA